MPSPTPPSKQRVMAHVIVWQGREYPMHIAELDTATGELTLIPFTQELPSTPFYNGAILLTKEE